MVGALLYCTVMHSVMSAEDATAAASRGCTGGVFLILTNRINL